MGNQTSLTADQLEAMKLESPCTIVQACRANGRRVRAAALQAKGRVCFRVCVSPVTEAEIKRLFRKFKKLDVDKSGTLSVGEFLAIPELEHNPLVNRVVHTFDIDKSGEVDFREFVSSLSVFATHEAHGKEQKYKFTFRVYDVDNDGFISNADLYHVLKAMVGSNLNDVQLQQLVDRTILQGDKVSGQNSHCGGERKRT